MIESRFTDHLQRKQYGIFPGKITAVDKYNKSISFMYEVKDGVYTERTEQLFSLDGIEVGDVIDFRQYEKSPMCTVLEVKGTTPDAYIPGWAR